MKPEFDSLSSQAGSAIVGETLAELGDELIAFRRDLHTHPELAHTETRTTALVAARLAAAGVRVRPLTGTGLTADIGSVEPAYRVALRADLDTLPVAERTGLSFASQSERLCHACGHYVHVAAVLGAGLVLQQHTDLLATHGTGVRLIFQPGRGGYARGSPGSDCPGRHPGRRRDLQHSL